MRKHLIAIWTLAAAVASAKPNGTTTNTTKQDAPAVKVERVHANQKDKPIDAKPMFGKLLVFKDDFGGYYVSPDTAVVESDSAQQWVFFGDGKEMYQQRIVGFGASGADWEWNLWSPRAKGLQTAQFGYAKGKATLDCRQSDEKEGHRALTQLTADEALAFLKGVKFYPPLWRRQSKLLARDDEGVYYFVDQLRDEYGGNGFRVFVGMKGAMKEQAMTNVVSDSAGEIYATKTGALKIIAGKGGDAVWVKGGKRSDLTRLEPGDNRYLIYRDLGVYGALGAVCDDL
jgi:hypothetical protein